MMKNTINEKNIIKEKIESLSSAGARYDYCKKIKNNFSLEIWQYANAIRIMCDYDEFERTSKCDNTFAWVSSVAATNGIIARMAKSQ
jgi:hypothetical protein